MKKILPVAVLAAMAGVNGAQAVHVNPDGLGQVLLFPYYTTTGDQNTYINLVNTTNEYKAVKVRILESMNSQEVLDFNLYLSPQDHWSAVIYADPDGAGAVIRSDDNSCTVPNAINEGLVIPFRNTLFATDGRVNGLERTKEGYVEVIEMGTVFDGIDADEQWQDFILHAQPSGVPANCGALAAAWSTGGLWIQGSSEANRDLSAPTGGLYGYGILIDVQEGTSAGYDAVALENYVDPMDPFAESIHTNPGDTTPNLLQSTSQYDTIIGNTVVSGTASNGLDAVSAILMHNTIANDYVLETDIEGGTDFVITFPTKRDYVDNNPATDPFTVPWSSVNARSCEPFGIQYYNREELSPSTPISGPDFSPTVTVNQLDPVLCAEANVLTFNQGNVLEAFIADADDARNGQNLDLEDGFENGWAIIDFVNYTGTRPPLVAGVNTFGGLPVIGFAIQKYVNGTIEVDGEAVLSNYASIVSHKNARSTYLTPTP